MEFQDHFSRHSQDYARFRPHYPEALFRFLAEKCHAHRLAWDCATGNGQAALGLAPYFEKVVATDASERQLAQANRHPKVEYRLAPAEDSGLPAASVDLVTVAQAVHWFHFEKFFTECRRVAAPGAKIALWGYHLFTGTPEFNAAILRYYSEVVGPYWPPDRRWVEERYATLPFPFAELAVPNFEMITRWDLDAVLGYVGTWSATQRYREARGEDPLSALRRELEMLWGDPQQKRDLIWPMFMRLGRVE